MALKEAVDRGGPAKKKVKPRNKKQSTECETILLFRKHFFFDAQRSQQYLTLENSSQTL